MSQWFSRNNSYLNQLIDFFIANLHYTFNQHSFESVQCEYVYVYVYVYAYAYAYVYVYV